MNDFTLSFHTARHPTGKHSDADGWMIDSLKDPELDSTRVLGRAWVRGYVRGATIFNQQLAP